ncbi:TonB-dependent siderophore receptor [uncultured Microbulbifer sp.]|uniref:TonB-dependent receptor n=1 Tax=uncultured Microbulbifer sp. TaxID=348147 RepID=UPI0026051686|nr:TonB-dependent siderophore receptor [uncultured Microbulbifer sp.]
MNINTGIRLHYCVLISSIVFAGYAQAADEAKTENVETSDQTESKPVEHMVVFGSPVGNLGLNETSTTSNRLGLTAMETPATIEVIDAEVMRARGYTKLSDSLANLPGVVTGEQPSAPSTFSMRGFTRGQITVLRDGLWIGPSTMVMRPQNTFNLQRVEILRGPASVLNGIGSVAGTVNAITKSASADMDQGANLQLGYGSFDSQHIGVGSQGEIKEDLWYTLDLSHYDREGFIDRTNAESNNLTGSVFWKASDNLNFKLSADYLKDDAGSYYGTPLVPSADARDPLGVIRTDRDEVIDGAMRTNNYNVSDAYAKSDQLFLRLDSEWKINDSTRLQHTLFKFDADRAWQNAEGYVYCTDVVGTCTQQGEVQRYYGYFILDHEQEVLGSRLTLNIDSEFTGIESRSVFGVENTRLDFVRSRGFRRSVAQETGDGIDPWNPEPGSYGPRELRGVSPTDIDTYAVFFGNALQLTDKLSVVTGIRHEALDLNRENFNAEGEPESNGFARDYDWLSWRLGGVYSFSEDVMAYAQYSNAKDPVSSNIFLVNNNQDFDLTDAAQAEIGLKANWLEGNAESTIALYRIERDDIYERFSLDSVTNVGGRKSEGLEVSTSFTLSDDWRVGANAAYTNASFQRSANIDTFAGNTPPNVPELTASLFTSVDNVADLPLEVGGSVHYIDDRYGDNPNTVLLKGYTFTNLFAAYRAENYRITARIDNLFDEDYVSWSDLFYLHQDNPGFIYANQLMLGAPRSARIVLDYQF